MKKIIKICESEKKTTITLFIIFISIAFLFAVGLYTKTGEEVAIDFGSNSLKNKASKNKIDRFIRNASKRSVSSIDESSEVSIQFEKSLEEIFGHEEMSKAIINITIDSITELVKKPNDDLVSFCSKKTNCPFELNQIYKTAFQKLHIFDQANIKAILQKSMLATDMEIQDKVRLLVDELQSPEIALIQNKSFRDKNGRPQFTNEVIYLLATQNRLFSLASEVDQSIDASLKAIQNLNDPVGKIVLATSLFHRFPEIRNQLAVDLEGVGIEAEQLRNLLQVLSY